MKRSVSLLITILLFSLSVMSEGIDRTTALKRAQAFMPGKQFVTGKNMPSALSATVSVCSFSLSASSATMSERPFSIADLSASQLSP